MSANTPTAALKRTFRHFAFGPEADFDTSSGHARSPIMCRAKIGPTVDQSGGYGFSNVEDSISQQERNVPGPATGASDKVVNRGSSKTRVRLYGKRRTALTQHQYAKSGRGC